MSSNWLGYDLSSPTYGIGGWPEKPKKIVGWTIAILLCIVGIIMCFYDFGIFKPVPFGAAVLVLLGTYEL